MHRHAALLVLGVVSSACGNASISDMRPHLAGSSLQCWLTLNFKAPPKGVDPKDVRVVFSSVVLFQDESFDWDYITAHDHQFKTQVGSMGMEETRYTPDDATTAELVPGAGTKMTVLFQIPSKREVKIQSGDDTGLTATLYWGNKKQDSSSRGLFLVYQRK